MNTIISTIVAAILSALLLTFTNIEPHKCNFDDCEMKGNLFFSSQYEEDTDGYLMDRTHWENPQWDGETIEEYIFHVTK